MQDSFLLSRVLLQFDSKSDDLLEDISAVARTPDGSLWFGSDELLTLERLQAIEPNIYGNHQQFQIGDFIELHNQEDEIDIEGMDYSDGYLWFTGSHGTKRKKPKGKKPAKDIKRLAKIKRDENRYLLARIPVFDGNLVKSYTDPECPDRQLSAASLQKTEKGNILMDVIENDVHFGAAIAAGIPSKENGFDVEGLAVSGDKIFLGLRGPVLRGWAIVLELEVEETEPGVLTLKPIGKDGRHYKKHFLDLNGLGIRELCLDGENLIVLAGPTLALEGEMAMYRLHDVLDWQDETIVERDGEKLEVLFDLPFTIGTDHAEGLTLFPCLGQPNSLLVVYDSPDPARFLDKKSMFVDAFKIKR